jgi:hypothetical protein
VVVLCRREAAAGKLTFGEGRYQMSQTELEREANNPAEPLLPVEKKLIGWSLGIGLVSLAILVIVNHFLPIPV